MQKRSSMVRIIKVAAAMCSPQGANIRQLSVDLNASTKTIRRDRDFLRDRLGLQIEQEVIDSPWSRFGIEYRHRAFNAEQVLPLIETLNRFVI